LFRLSIFRARLVEGHALGFFRMRHAPARLLPHRLIYFHTLFKMRLKMSSLIPNKKAVFTKNNLGFGCQIQDCQHKTTYIVVIIGRAWKMSNFF
jgi:hypothetical protein